MLKNATVTAFPVSELLRENQQGVKLRITPPRLPIRLNLELDFILSQSYVSLKLC